jgi:uncharacterized protein (DUF433 family)
VAPRLAVRNGAASLPYRIVGSGILSMSQTDTGVKRVMGTWDACQAVERYPDRVSGAWVFRGTRVPVASLFENLRDGASIEEFLAWLPGVEPSQVEAVLDTEAAAARSSR